MYHYIAIENFLQYLVAIRPIFNINILNAIDNIIEKNIALANPTIPDHGPSVPPTDPTDPSNPPTDTTDPSTTCCSVCSNFEVTDDETELISSASGQTQILIKTTYNDLVQKVNEIVSEARRRTQERKKQEEKARALARQRARARSRDDDYSL